MAFSFPFFSKKKSDPVFFGIHLSEVGSHGVLFRVVDQKPIVIAQQSQVYSSGFENILEDIDKLISSLEALSNTRVDKTIFFLHTFMIDPKTHDILEPYKGIIKNLSKELELNPMGYIDLQESMMDYLKRQSIVSALLVEVDTSRVAIAIYKGGKTTHASSSSRSQSLAEDVAALLAELPAHSHAPTKMIVYGYGDLQHIASDLSAFAWNEKLFVQHPTIDIVSREDLTEHLIYTFGEELDKQDIAAPTEAPSKDEASGFGFVMGGDVQGDPEPPATVATSAGRPTASAFDTIQTKVTTIFTTVKGSLGGSSQKTALIAGITFLALVVIFVLVELFAHKLELTVTMAAETVEDEITVTLPFTDEASDELALITHTAVKEVEQEAPATGEREIGEKATGEVNILNFDSSEKTFPRGTELSLGDLIFTTDSEVKVASSSGISSDGSKQSGKAKVAATAADIGTKYNIEKGKQLKVSGQSESLFAAVVETAFTGGSEETVKTVSRQDIDKLETQVEELLESASDEEGKPTISGDEVLIPQLTEAEVSDSEFTREVGEEADEVAITATSETRYVTVNKKLMQEYLLKELKETISKDKNIAPESIEFEVIDVDTEEDADEATLEIAVTAGEFKPLEAKDALAKLKMKPLAAGIETLQESKDVKKVEVKKHTLPLPWGPFFSKNVTVTISTK
ncbi:MAG: baseplate J/gp47 family protein [Weeksellaceae bacterium]